MCGIFGVLSFLGEPDIKKAEIAVNTLKHRGPDNQSCEKVNLWPYSAFNNRCWRIQQSTFQKEQCYSCI